MTPTHSRLWLLISEEQVSKNEYSSIVSLSSELLEHSPMERSSPYSCPNPERSKITTPHKFILNQLALDLLSCICLVLVYGWKIIETDLRFIWNFLSCLFVASETLVWFPVSASIANLILITLERYSKIVHTPLYKKYYHSWMTYFLILTSWIVGALITFPPDLVSVDYSNVICGYYTKWPNPYDGLVFSSAVFCMNYANPMLIFIFCYLRILLVMRNSASFFAKDNSANNVSSAHQKSQVAIIKTMIIITVLFRSVLVTELPFASVDLF